jgi:sulfotransferase 6B1
MNNNVFNYAYRFSTRLIRAALQKAGKAQPETVYLSSPVLVNSIPKSGTNLLKNIVFAIPNAHFVKDMSLASMIDMPKERLVYIKDRISDLSPGCVYTGHIPYSPAIADWINKQGIKQVFICRDPRDVTVSLYHYVMKEKPKRHAAYEMYAALGSDSERLLGSICGIGEGRTKYKLSPSSMPNIKMVFDAYEKWLSDENTFVIRYEDLTGADENRIGTIEKMLSFLGVPFNQQLVENILILGEDTGKSRTFRRGGSGAWKEEYSEIHIKAFRSIAGDLLDKWGYSW